MICKVLKFCKYKDKLLKEVFPEKEDDIEKMSDYICNAYSDEPDKIKERLWYKFFEQAYMNKHLMLDTYKQDKKLSE